MANEPQAVDQKECVTDDLGDAGWLPEGMLFAYRRYQLREEKDQRGRSRTVVTQHQEQEGAVVVRWFFHRIGEPVDWTVAQEAISLLPVAEHE
jgi:hypothetical protein